MDNSSPAVHSAERDEVQSPPVVTVLSDVLLYREGLAASLGRDGRVRVLDIVACADAVQVISRRQPDALLLDAGAADCLQLAGRLRAIFPGLRMVGFGIGGGADRLVDCAESGLASFVESDGTVADLVAAVLGALKGELSCSARVSALMCERLARLSRHASPPVALTRRENEIALLIGEGLSNKEIARDLHIGASTVKNHVHSILEKLKVRRRAAIAERMPRRAVPDAACPIS